MWPSLIKRIERLEADRGELMGAQEDPEDKLMRILLEGYYSDQDPQLTPEQEQMLEATVQWYHDNGLDYLLEGATP